MEWRGAPQPEVEDQIYRKNIRCACDSIGTSRSVAHILISRVSLSATSHACSPSLRPTFPYLSSCL